MISKYAMTRSPTFKQLSKNEQQSILNLVDERDTLMIKLGKMKEVVKLAETIIEATERICKELGDAISNLNRKIFEKTKVGQEEA